MGCIASRRNKPWNCIYIRICCIFPFQKLFSLAARCGKQPNWTVSPWAKWSDCVCAVKFFIIIGIVSGLFLFHFDHCHSYGGAGLNPATCLGPKTVRGGLLWNGHWIFVGWTSFCSIHKAHSTWTFPRDSIDLNNFHEFLKNTKKKGYDVHFGKLNSVDVCIWIKI
jgi:hypothetical protein